MTRMILMILMLVVMAAPAWADSTCDVGERSVRGYCPDDPGHDDERRALFDDDDEHPGPTFPETGYSDDELPRTGADPLSLLLAAVALLGAGTTLLSITNPSR